MLATTIRFFFQLYCSTYAYYKISNIATNCKQIKFNSIMFSLLVSIIFSILPSYSFTNKILGLYILFFLYIKLFTHTTFSIAFTVSIISYGLSFISLALSGLLIGIMVTPFMYNPQNIYSVLYIFLGGIGQYLFIYFLFKINRLKNGMPFLLKRPILSLGVMLTVFIIGYNCTLFTLNPLLYPLNLLTMILILLLAIALLIWWRRKITQSYVEKLRVSEVETLYKDISDKDLEIEKLRANNEQLAGIIHKDNKLIPAMELAVRNYLQTATLMKPEDAKQMGTDLLAKLERMSEERTGIIHTYQEANSYRQRCGLASIDAIVDYMENRATELGIEYHYQYDKGIKEMLPAYIGEDDAMHLLSDVIENAIIASNHNEKKTVHIHIGFIQSTLFMDISDSGIPFDPETYQNLGMLQHTTHKEHGGSGIGLMDLGKLKKQYKFSLHIYEYPETEPVYTKKIRILFDKKNHYLIQSYRAGEIRTAITRNDLHIFQYTDTQNEFPTLDDKSKRFT